MPRVPEYRSNVQSAAAPNVRFRDNSNLEAFGGGQASQPVFNAVERTGQILNKYEQESFDRANQTALESAKDKLIKADGDLKYNAEYGYMHKKGVASFGVPKEYGERFEKTAAEIEDSLANDTQKNAFRQYRTSRKTAFDTDIQRYVFTEADRVTDETTKSALETSRQDAVLNYRNNELRDSAFSREEFLILEHSKRQGWSPEITDLQLRTAKSNTHEAVLSRAIAAGDSAFAQEYFLKNGDSLVGPSRNAIEKAMEELNLRGNSTRQADQIVASSPDWQSALAKTKDIEDPKLRDETTRRVNAIYGEQDRAKKQRIEDQYLASVNLIEANPGRNPKDLVPATTWSQLSITQRESLEKRATAPAENDNKTWLDFLEKTDDEVAAMSRSDFESYWVKFDKDRRAKAETQWESAKKAALNGETGSKAKAYLTQTMTFNQQFDSTIRNSGLINRQKAAKDLNDEEGKLYADLQQAAIREVEEFETEKRRKATPSERQAIIDKSVLRTVFVDKPWARDPKRPAGLPLQEDEQDRVYVPIKDIPKKEAESIRLIFQSKGQQLTDSKMERFYAAILTKNRRLMNSILGE